MTSDVLHLFEGYGIEIGYMIVDAENLDISPLADRVLVERGGAEAGKWENGPITWCHGMPRHLLKLRSSGPQSTLAGLADHYRTNTELLDKQLEAHGARLLPGGMHPWMDPREDVELWPFGHDDIHEAYDRIFSCRGHGWVNAQDTRIGLSFSGDEEFARLHAAIRLVLPLLPALAASSPYADGLFQGFLDYRLEARRRATERIPEVAGDVVPETVRDMTDYQETVLAPMYRAIAPLDQDGLLQSEWLNSRGAIARVDRNTIEISVIDSQENPTADMAVAEVTSLLVRALVDEAWSDFAEQQAMDQLPLVGNFTRAIREGESADITGRAYLERLGILTSEAKAGKLWGTLVDQLASRYGLTRDTGRVMEHLLRHGTLARRLLRAAGPAPDHTNLLAVYRRLADCLAAGEMFKP
jgi:gamma-glutamyl:cysteine ligase YbdK (ATP-grasp superfamily)